MTQKYMEIAEVVKFFSALKILPKDNITYIEFSMVPAQAEIEYSIDNSGQTYGGGVKLTTEQEYLILNFLGLEEHNVFELRMASFNEGPTIIDVAIQPESRL